MKKIIYIAMLTLLSTVAYAQKQNLDKLSEKERNEYLLKTAYPVVMKHAPEWYCNYKEPEIRSFVMELGSDKGRKVYSVRYFHDPEKWTEMKYFKFSVAVSFWAATGEVNGISFGDGLGCPLNVDSKTRSGEDKFYRENHYLKK